MSALKIASLSVISLVLVIGLAYFVYRGKPMSHTNHAVVPSTSYKVRYLPLGDSYTIGQSVYESQRWPNQLTAKINQSGGSVGIVANPAVTGYTTEDLIQTELPLVSKLKPTFVTVQIGVNDYVQGQSAESFQKNLAHILDYLQQNMKQPAKILLVTIPDYPLTPTGATFGPPAAAETGIKSFNAIIKKAAQERRLPIADIFPISQQVTDDARLITDDGLHPSGKQYSLWTDTIYNAGKGIIF